MTTDSPRRTRWLAVVATFVAAVLAVPAAAETPIPELTLWRAQMLSFGRAACDALAQPPSLDEALVRVYYDAERVFYQIAGDTGDASWEACARRAEAIFRDQYVLPQNGNVPGYWNFTHGLTLDWLQTGDAASKNAVIALSQNASYAGDTVPLEWTQPAYYSREVAYAIMSYLNAEKVGAPARARLPLLVDQALGHLDQWFVSGTALCPSECDPPEAVGRFYVQPFMAGLTAEALIMYFDKTGDARILPAIKTALDWLWANAWIGAEQAFWYDNVSRSAAPDLNLLIAPAFAWVYAQTGDVTYRERGDLVFAGGVLRAFLGAGKQFNQNYAWSFDYVRWRGGVGAPPPPPPPGGTLQVAVTQPSAGTTVSGTAWAVVWLSGAAGAANDVTLTLGGRTVGTTTSASPGPISLPYDTRLTSDGAQTLTVSARDAGGNTGTAGVSIVVGNGTAPLPPPPPPAALTASIVTPAAGATVSATTTVTLAAAGGTPPYTYTLALDGTTLVSGGAATFAWNTAAASNAAHTLTATVRDANGQTATATRTVTVLNGTAPVGTLRVAVTQPTSGATVSGSAWAVVWISGATGSANSVTLTLGGHTVGTTTSASPGPISLPYDTRLAADGAQTLAVSARDAGGNTGTGGVSIVVANGTTAPPPPPPPPAALIASITAPAANATVGGTTTVTMAASGGVAPYTYTLALDGATLVSGGGVTYAWNTAATSDAAHTLTLTVRDAAGATATASRAVTVSNVTPPPPTGSLEVFVTQPRSATTVRGTAWIVVWLDGAAGGANVYTVSVNGQAVATQTTASTGPVSLPWLTTGTPNGAQEIRVTVRDAAGKTGAASVSVTVAN
ncbi:MAG TPA: Ig-like domain-containing protein [Methylomirabilota bacterium]|nr:Ig-like domain-containing protein [Methylomirabilota bacterium]